MENRESLSAVVVGRVRGEELDLLRVEFDHGRVRGGVRPSGCFRHARVTTLGWEEGSALGEPLEHLLGWKASEPVLLAVPTPPLFGRSSTITFEGPGAPGSPRDLPVDLGPAVGEREIALEVRWRIRESVREEAAEFLVCSEEDVVVVAEDVHIRKPDRVPGAPEATATCLVAGPDPVADARGYQSGLFPASPPDIPDCQLVLLPVLLGEVLSPVSESVGLFLLEESRATFVTWQEGMLRSLATLPLGGMLLPRYLCSALNCSSAEAAVLLARVEHGDASPDAARVLARVLQALVPLFSGAWALFGAALPLAERPAQLFVAGLWPAVVSRRFCRPHFLARATRAPATPRVLPLSLFSSPGPPLTGSDSVSRPWRLLAHMAEAVAVGWGRPRAISGQEPSPAALATVRRRP